MPPVGFFLLFFKKNVFSSSEFRFRHHVDFRGRSYPCDLLQLERIQHEGWYRRRHPRTIWNAIIQARQPIFISPPVSDGVATGTPLLIITLTVKQTHSEPASCGLDLSSAAAARLILCRESFGLCGN